MRIKSLILASWVVAAAGATIGCGGNVESFQAPATEDEKLASAAEVYAFSVCLVTDKPLTNVASPVEIYHDGYQILVVDEAAKAKFEERPDPYMTKLKRALGR